MTVYYKSLGIHPKTRKYEKVTGVYRRADAVPWHPERWDGRGWEDFPPLYDASGINGDHDFHIITEKEAKELMVSLFKGVAKPEVPVKAEGEKGRFITLEDDRVVFIDGPGQGAGGTEAQGGVHSVVGTVQPENVAGLLQHYQQIPEWARKGVKGLAFHAEKGERFEAGGKGFVTAAEWDRETGKIDVFDANRAGQQLQVTGYTPIEHEVGHSLWDRWIDDAGTQAQENKAGLEELWRLDAPQKEVDARIAKLAPLFAAKTKFDQAWQKGQDGITSYSKAWATPSETIAEMAEQFLLKGGDANAAKELKELCREHRASGLYAAFMQMVRYYQSGQ